MTKKVFLILLALVLAFSVGIIGCTAPAQQEEEEEPEVITLKFGSFIPETHFSAQDIVLPWQIKITAETGGLIQWENYFGTLVSPSNTYGEIQAGLVDVGMVYTSAESVGFAIQNSLQPFFIGAESQECQLAVYRDIVEMFPEIEEEFSEVKILENGSSMPMYQLMTSEPAIRSLADIAGLQLKCLVPHIEPLAELGASGQEMSMWDVYPSMETGIIDGLLGPSDVLKTVSLADVVNYHTTLNLPGGPLTSLTMNRDVWNSLSPDIQQVFEDNRQFFSEKNVGAYASQIAEGIAYGVQEGVELIQLAPEELEELYDVFREAAVSNAAQLDAQGLPGTEIYNEVQRLIAEYQAG